MEIAKKLPPAGCDRRRRRHLTVTTEVTHGPFYPKCCPGRAKKNQRAQAEKPEKPYDDFPLKPHPRGYWTKRIKGKDHHFGRWARVVDGVLTPVPYEPGWQAALTLYQAQVDDINLGRTPRATMVNGTVTQTNASETIKDLSNRFLTAKRMQLESGELGARMFEDYFATCELLAAQFGNDRRVADLAADDFERLRAKLAKRCGPTRLGNEIKKVRTLFKYGFEAGLLKTPVRFGPQFKKPSRRIMRKQRADAGPRLFTADEIRRLLAAASPKVKAMILLGINAGFGNADCGTLTQKALDLDNAIVDYARPETGIPRRCILWAETIAAISEALAKRPAPKDKGVASRSDPA